MALSRPARVGGTLSSSFEFRPTEVNNLLGDCSKARRELGWSHRISFDQLITEMVQADLKLIS